MTDLARLPHSPSERQSVSAPSRITIERPASTTTAPVTEAFRPLIELGVTYRQLDYWCRKGMIALSTPAAGTGSRREVTPVEVEAIKALIAELASIETRTRFLRSGDFFEAKVNELTHRAERP